MTSIEEQKQTIENVASNAKGFIDDLRFLALKRLDRPNIQDELDSIREELSELKSTASDCNSAASQLEADAQEAAAYAQDLGGGVEDIEMRVEALLSTLRGVA
jgi:chromosome segregation ATPase